MSFVFSAAQWNFFNLLSVNFLNWQACGKPLKDELQKLKFMEQSHWIVIGENLLERSHLFQDCLIVQELQHRK